MGRHRAAGRRERQRFGRWVRAGATAGALGLGATLLAACQPFVLEVVVNSTADVVDAAPGDGVCETATAGQCTLRAAVQEANAADGPAQVTLPAGTYELTLGGASEDAAATGDLDVTGDVTLVGPGAIVHQLSSDRVFHVIGSGATAVLNGLTVRGGQAYNRVWTWPGYYAQERAPGGGTLVQGGAMTMLGGRVTGNQASRGGGISVASGSLALIATTVDGNTSHGWGTPAGHGSVHHPAQGGGIQVADGSATILASVVSGNRTITDTTFGGGAGIAVGLTVLLNGSPMDPLPGTVSLERSTVAGNDAGAGEGGGLRTVSTEPVRLAGSTVAGNTAATGGALAGTGIDARGSVLAGTAAPVCTTPLAASAYDVVSDTSCGATGPGDVQGVDPQLGALGPNGGSTATMLPAPSSPTLNRIPIGTAGLCDQTTPTDQRGQARPSGPGCDAGSVEIADPTRQLSVDSADDARDAAPGDGTCDTGDGRCTLRAAVDETNAAERQPGDP